MITHSSVFTPILAEEMVMVWTIALKKGSLPVIDLSGFAHLDLRALNIVLSFAHAARSGRLTSGVEVPPLEFRPPNTPAASNFLVSSEFFKIAAQPEVFIGANALSRLRSTRPENKPALLPAIPFRRVVEGHELLTEARFEDECQQFVNNLQTSFRHALIAHLSFDRIGADRFWIPNKEIVQNIYMHSGSWGFGALQCYRNGVVIAYSDLGRGILESLTPIGRPIASGENRSWNDATAIEMAFRDGVTSLPGKSEGYGLALTAEYVLQHGGQIECRSGAAKLAISQSGQNVSAVAHLPGVQIGIFLPRLTDKHARNDLK